MSKVNQILFAVIVIQCFPGMIFMAGRYIALFKTANNETGIHGMGIGVDIFGSATVIIVPGNINMKKGRGGILPGTISPDHAN